MKLEFYGYTRVYKIFSDKYMRHIFSYQKHKACDSPHIMGDRTHGNPGPCRASNFVKRNEVENWFAYES